MDRTAATHLPESGRVRAFVATSLDGFLAGEEDDLSWLPGPSADGDDAGFGAFLARVGALLMGRRTFDVVDGFDGPWPYGERPVLVATHRPLLCGRPGVRAVTGPVSDLVAAARRAAGSGDVYVDGGEIVRQALDAGLLDELTVTIVPIVLGRGRALGAGARARHPLTLTTSRALAGGLVQLTYRVARTC
jgi:dihydrofolate reductase